MAKRNPSSAFRPVLNVAVLQMLVDERAAWPSGPPMGESEAAEALRQLRVSFSVVSSYGMDVDVVVLPELSLPRHAERAFALFCERLGAIGIAGLDYRLGRDSSGTTTASNEAVIVVPTGWPARGHYTHSARFYIGKTFYAPREKQMLEAEGIRAKSDPTMWLLDAGACGRIAVVICYDLMDIHRAAQYRGLIQHMFVLANNRDVETFTGLAETIARTTFCNVLICNNGLHGGSVVVSPRRVSWKRIIYSHKGASLKATQVVGLPVRDLVLAQRGNQAVLNDADGLKAPPPGFPLPEHEEIADNAGHVDLTG